MAGRDPERIADTLRSVGLGTMFLNVSGEGQRVISAAMLVIAAEEMDRMREYLLETSGRLHQHASDHQELTEADMRDLAKDMCRMANRRDPTT